MLAYNVQAIVIDLDGTLLNSKKQVSERNKKAILKAHWSGISIIFATARAPRSVKVFLPQELQEIASFVYYNGAFILDETMNYRQHYPIESSITNKIIEYLADCSTDLCLSIESEDKWYSNKTIDYSAAMNAVVNPIIVSLAELTQIKASKILITQYPYYTEFQKQFAHEVNSVCTDAGALIQIMAKNVSKERAVYNLCARKKIPMDKVMAFGDDWNDLGLFNACGYPIAMGNAISELKNIAFFITLTNNEDGVAEVIERVNI